MTASIRNPIPFSEPTISAEEEAAVVEALRNRLIIGDGPVCSKAEQMLREITGAKHALLTTSCTHALEVTLIALDVKPGDEIILPSFTFTSSATSIVRQGARPVFVDIDPRTFNLDPERVEAAVTPKTRCIMPVHYGGQGCEMDALASIAKRHGLDVVEDAAQGMGATWDGKHLGTLGRAGCISFHATKNVVCGEGGALLTSDDDLSRRAEIAREKGTNRAAFLRGQVDKYTWVGPGSSYVLADLLAAMLCVQLKRMEELNRQRMEIWNAYYAGTEELERLGLAKRPHFHPKASNNGHLFSLLVTDGRRDQVMKKLRSRGISVTFHYVPLHSSPFITEYLGGSTTKLPVTDRVSAELMRLPIYSHMTPGEVTYVIEQVNAVFKE